ncbi:hypothetical protein [Megasphaera sp.]|uniref:hypothetical protein n=1 Tax=Megasphaera sp. TaxID=2023260 RepID=UPI003F7ED48B
MTKDEVLNFISTEIVSTAKALAKSALGDITADDLKKVVSSQLAVIIDPLQQEADSTTSLWVKIRNKLEIFIINKAVDDAINAIIAGISADVAQQK